MAIDFSKAYTGAGTPAPVYIKKGEQNKGGLLGGIGYLGEKAATSFVAGIEGIWDYSAGGLAKLFGADDWAEEQFESDWFGDWYYHPDEWYNPSGAWKVAGDVAGGIGSSLPGIASVGAGAAIAYFSGGTLSPMAAGLISAGTMGLSAAGTSTKEAYKKTGELGGKEFAYGAISGVVEGGTEAITNALSLGTGAVVKNISKSFGKEVTETVAKTGLLKSFAGTFAGETFEEGFSTWINPYVARATYDAEAKNATLNEIGYSAFTGGLAGVLMNGASISVDAATSLSQGAKAVNTGRAQDILNASKHWAEYEEASPSGNETLAAIKETYKALSESLAKTGGEVRTIAQKKMLGDLQRANAAAVFMPMVAKSAANVIANAETVAEAMNAYGYTDANGNKISYTAEQIREGFNADDPKSIWNALKTNEALRTITLGDVTGHLAMDTKAFREATLSGKKLAGNTDLTRFYENASADEINAVSEALGIESWSAITPEAFEEKVDAFIQSGGADRYKATKAFRDEASAYVGDYKRMPRTISIADGQTGYYTADGERIAIRRSGDEYTIFDVDSGKVTRNMTRAEVNKALGDYNAKKQDNLLRAEEKPDRTAQIKREREDIEAYARENVSAYKELPESARAMVRKVIRGAREAGIAEGDIVLYANVSAHAGIDVVFRKELCRVGKKYADGFYDADANRIVVNPDGTRSAEKLLLHELDHAIRLAYGKNGRAAIIKEAYEGLTEEERAKVRATYGKADAETLLDEMNAFYAEKALTDAGVLERLWKNEKTLGERIIEFFAGAKDAYTSEKRLHGAAKRYEKMYREMFKGFAEANRGRNAQSGSGGGSVKYRITNNLLIDKYPNLNLNEDISDKDGVPAIRLEDGSVITFTEPHVSFIQQSGLDVEDIESGGWISAGVYEASERSDTLRYKERMLAKKRMDKKRATKQDEKTAKYALPIDDKALNEMIEEMRGEGIPIERGSVVLKSLPIVPDSGRGKVFSRETAIKAANELLSLSHLGKSDKKSVVNSILSALNGCRTVKERIEYAEMFSRAYVEKIMSIKIEHSDVADAARIKNLLGIGREKITFTAEDIVELRNNYGATRAKTFLSSWAKKSKSKTDYPLEVYLRDVANADAEIASKIDGKTPIEAMILLEKEYTDAIYRLKSGRYFDLYPDKSEVKTNILVQDVYLSIMQSFDKADRSVVAQAIERAEQNADFWQAKTEEQIADDAFFREALKEDYERRAKNLNERNKADKERLQGQVKLATFEKKSAVKEAESLKKKLGSAERDTLNEKRRADFLEARLDQERADDKRMREAQKGAYEKQLTAHKAKSEQKILKLEGKLTDAEKRREATVEAYEKKIENIRRDKQVSLQYLQKTHQVSRIAADLRDMKKGVFESSTEYHTDTFDRIIGDLASIGWKKMISTNKVRNVFGRLSTWYDAENPLFKDVSVDEHEAFDADISAMIKALANGNGALTVDDLTSLDKVLRYFVNFIKTYNKVWYKGKWIDAVPTSEAYIGKAREAAKYSKSFKGLGPSYLQTFGDPMSVARRADGYIEGGFFTDMMEEVRAAAIESDLNYLKVMERYEEFMAEHPKYLRDAEKATVKFGEHEIPKMQFIGLYMSSKREQAHAGLLSSGFSYVDAKGDIVRVEGFALDTEITPENALSLIAAKQQEMYKLLTDEDKQYIEVLERGYTKDARDLKASRDMQRYGFTNATDGYYYPIQRANTRKKIDVSASAEVDRVSKASFNQDIVKGAAGELFIDNADALYRRHVRAVCQYAALSPAIETYNKLFNTDISGNKNKPVSLHTETQGTWALGQKYMRELMEDVQGIKRERGTGQEILGKIRSGYAKFQLGANPKTLATQLSSAFAATSIIDADSIAKGAAISGKDVDEYCPLAKLRNSENTAAMAQGVLTKTQKVSRGIDKVGDAMMKPIGMMDRFTITRLFAACQAQVEKNGGAKVGSVENKTEAGKLLTKVIIETQQNSFASERSAAMRDGNEILKTLTMFSADAMKTVCRVIDAFGEAVVTQKRVKDGSLDKAELKAVNKKLGGATFALIGVAVYSAVIAQLFRFLYNKDKDEDETVLSIMLADVSAGMLGGLPIIKELYSRFTDGFAVESYALSSLNDMIDAFYNVTTLAPDLITGKASGEEIPGRIRSLAYAAGQFTGIPVRNIYNVLFGITKRVAPNAAYKVDDIFVTKNYVNDLKKAVASGDTKRADMLVATITGQRVGAVTEEASAELNRLTVGGYSVIPREIATSFSHEGETYDMSEDEYTMVSELYSQTVSKRMDMLLRSATYKAFTEDQKAVSIKKLYDLAFDSAIEDVYGADRGTQALLSGVLGADTVAAFYTSIKGITSDKDKKGETIAGSKKAKITAEIKKLSVSTEEKYLLICAQGYTLTENAKARMAAYINRLRVTNTQKQRLAKLCGLDFKNGRAKA